MRITFTLFILLIFLGASAQEIKAIDSIVVAEMKAKNIPALAIGVIKNGKLAHVKALWL